MLRILTLVTALLLMSPKGARAELVTELSAGTTFDNNIFGTLTQTEDAISELSTYIARKNGGERSETRFYYAGSGYLFGQSADRSFTIHEGGISYVLKPGEGRSRIYAGASVDLRLGRAVYNVYDFGGFSAHLVGKWYPVESLMLRGGYSLTTRNYWRLDTSSYTDQSVFAQATRFLATRTTLRGDVNFSHKTHFGSEAQWVLGLQVAQSLRDGTGLSVRFQRRANTGGSATQDAAGAFVADEDILVDRYDYSGHAWRVQLTQQLPKASLLRLTGSTESQLYDGQEALDVLGLGVGQVRSDRVTYGEASLEIPFGTRYELGVNYRYETGRSNDLYYDYSGRHVLGAGLDVSF